MLISILSQTIKQTFGTLSKIKRNPYIQLSPQQIQQLIAKQIKNRHRNIEHLNILIKLGLAHYFTVKRYGLQIKDDIILNKSLQLLQNIHKNINQQEISSQLSQLELGMFIELIRQKSGKKAYKQYPMLLYYYQNTYRKLLPFQINLQIFEQSKIAIQQQLKIISIEYQNDNNLRESKEKLQSLQNFYYLSKQIIQNQIQYTNLNFSIYIKYCRLFLSEIKPQNFQKKIKSYVLSADNLNDRQKGTICYIATNLLTQQQYQQSMIQLIQPDLSLTNYQHDDSKLICLILQILKYKNIPITFISKQFIGCQRIYWDYEHIVWVSQFINKQKCQQDYQIICNFLNKQLTKQLIPSTASLYNMITYLQNMKDYLYSQKHMQISKWMASQKILVQSPQDLTVLLQKIEDNKWGQYYHQFLKQVVKTSLGRYQWETQNKIYFYGIIWRIDDENMEYLRRYILNGYASLGVNRREIPITSYFYKILGVTQTKQFYKNL